MLKQTNILPLILSLPKLDSDTGVDLPDISKFDTRQREVLSYVVESDKFTTGQILEICQKEFSADEMWEISRIVLRRKGNIRWIEALKKIHPKYRLFYLQGFR